MYKQFTQEPSFRLVSVNIEADKHLQRVLPFLAKEQPDIVCLQEVFADDLPLFEDSLGMRGHYAPMTLRPRHTYNTHQPVSMGVAILSKQPLSRITKEYYAAHGYPAGEPPLFNRQQNTVQKVLVSADVNLDGRQLRIGTTHFTWSPEGQPNDEQRQDLASLLTVLANHPQIILCGDFNAPRGGEVCNAIEQHYTNNIPPHITTTLDQHLHRVKGLQHVVDHIFSTPAYSVSNVEVADGVSDHCALTAAIQASEVSSSSRTSQHSVAHTH